MYVQKQDLERYLTDSQLQTLTRIEEGTTDLMAQSLEDAENYVLRRLNYKYDMETELAKTEDDRDRTLIKIISFLAIYFLTLSMDLLDPEGKFYQMYERAEEDINKIEKGTLLSDYLTFQDEEKQQILYGKDENIDLNY